MSDEYFAKLADPESYSNGLKKFEHTAAGAHSDSYEKFVRKVFTPADHLTRTSSALADYTDVASEMACGNPIPQIPTSLLLKLEKMENGGTDEEPKLFSPLEMMHQLYGRYGIEDSAYKKYPVYQPKSSSEYHSILNKKPTVDNSPAVGYKVSNFEEQNVTPRIHHKNKKVAKMSNSPNVWSSAPSYERKEHRINTHSSGTMQPSSADHMMIDYSSFSSPKLSPYLYKDPGYIPHVHRSDSRIVGSDFVMLSVRRDEPWNNKVDKLLADAKKLD